MNHNGKEYEKEYMYIYITESFCCTMEIRTLFINYISMDF